MCQSTLYITVSSKKNPLVMTHLVFDLSCFLPCLYQQAPRASSYPKRGIPAPNVYNLQRSFTDKCDFSVGASRVFRLPVGVQLDSPKHMTPAPNHYNVCIDRVAFVASPPFKCKWLVFSLSGQVTYTSCGAQRVSSVGTSAFLSKTGRYSFHGDHSLPSPCKFHPLLPVLFILWPSSCFHLC